jgi:hypothetical protein
MSTATLTPASEVAAERIRYFEAAEEICTRLANGEERTPDDDLVFAAIPWNEREIIANVDRLKRVKETLTRAGSPAELAAAKKLAEELPEQHREERSKLQEQLQAIEDRLAQINREERDAASRLSVMEGARAALRVLGPPTLKIAIERLRANLRDKLNPQIGECVNRQNWINNVLSWDIGNGSVCDEIIRTHWSSVSSEEIRNCIVRPSAPPKIHPDRNEHGWSPTTPSNPSAPAPSIDRAKWNELRSALTAELPTVEERLAALKKEQTDACKQIDDLLDYYWLNNG